MQMPGSKRKYIMYIRVYSDTAAAAAAGGGGGGDDDDEFHFQVFIVEWISVWPLPTVPTG